MWYFIIIMLFTKFNRMRHEFNKRKLKIKSSKTMYVLGMASFKY